MQEKCQRMRRIMPDGQHPAGWRVTTSVRSFVQVRMSSVAGLSQRLVIECPEGRLRRRACDTQAAGAAAEVGKA
jgi:hypothetical protein